MELNYGKALYNVSKRYEEPDDQKGITVLDNCDGNTTAVLESTFETKLIVGKRWSHSVQFGVNFGVEIDIGRVGEVTL